MEDPETFLDDGDSKSLEQPQVPVSGGVSASAPVRDLSSSPRWSATTKLVIALALVAIGGLLLVRLLNIVAPLLLSFILAYLIYPIAERTYLGLRLPWRVTVTIVFLFVVLVLIGSFAVGGLAVVEQLQKLIEFIQSTVKDLPALVTDLTSRPFVIGPFTINTKLLDANQVVQQVLGIIQPVLSQAGTSIVSLVSGTATVIGWMFFILLIAYFILSESASFPNRFFKITIPNHEEDIRRMGNALNAIWEAFLRRQLIIVLLTIFAYSIILGAYQVRFFFGLALLAGLARFIPYVGPFAAWTTYGLVSYFQGHTAFGLSPLAYVLLVVGTAWVLDMFMDNYVVPRMMSNALRIHPAAVMIFALVSLNLLGVVGMVLAAPVLATIKLLFDYIFAKLFDQDPWANMATVAAPGPLPPLIPLLRQRFDHLVRRR